MDAEKKTEKNANEHQCKSIIQRESILIFRYFHLKQSLLTL